MNLSTATFELSGRRDPRGAGHGKEVTIATRSCPQRTIPRRPSSRWASGALCPSSATWHLQPKARPASDMQGAAGKNGGEVTRDRESGGPCRGWTKMQTGAQSGFGEPTLAGNQCVPGGNRNGLAARKHSMASNSTRECDADRFRQHALTADPAWQECVASPDTEMPLC